MLPIGDVFLGLVGRFYDQTASMISTVTSFPIVVNSAPVWLIGGHEYIASTEVESRILSSAFREELDSIPWMTYRSLFPPMTGDITTDNGWGCTLRSTQMLVATSLTRALLGDDFFIRKLSSNELDSLKRIYALFVDSENAPLGIHQSATRSQVFKPGEWFSPGSAAYLMAAQVQNAFTTGEISVSGMYAPTGRVSSAQILNRLDEASGVLIFIPLRLCSDDSLEIARYSVEIRKWFTIPQFRGFVGGDYISQSYYFVGASEQYLYILDPHTVQPAVTEVTDLSMQFPPQPVVATMRWARLSPTMTLAFFVRGPADLESIRNAKPFGLDVF